jgi:hypothetical protein
MEIYDIERRLGLVRVALDDSTSQWSIDYWTNVLAYLLRCANRTN